MMTISTRGRYATRIMVLLASEVRPSLTKYQIAEAEAITPAYVQQLLMALRLAGLVASHRGRVGGFSLARAPETITVGDVLRAVEGDVMPAPCRGTGHCDRAATCPTRPVWERAAELLEELFGSKTIADLAENGSPGVSNKRSPG
jgi:Rrf2 family cysteine metabolism transcriptional repressor